MNREQHIEAIFKNFHAIKRAYSHGSRFSHRHFGVTMTQASVLMLLMHEGRKTMSEVALALGVSKSAATQLLDSLIEQGFVERTQDEKIDGLLMLNYRAMGSDTLDVFVAVVQGK